MSPTAKHQALKPFVEGPLGNPSRCGPEVADLALQLAIKDGVEDSDPDAEARLVPHEIRLSSKTGLFSYQAEIVATLDEWATSATQDHRVALVSLPTGGGKTRTALYFLHGQLRRGLCRSFLWAAPSAELVDQAVDAAQDMWSSYSDSPETKVAVGKIPLPGLQESRLAAGGFVTAQLAARRIPEIKRFSPDVLVFDEAHQAVARTFRAIIEAGLSTGRTRVMGLTATPGRAFDDESEDLENLFASRLITAQQLGKDPVAELIRRGVLSKLQIKTIPLPRAWDNVRVTSFSGRSLSVEELAYNEQRFWAVVDAVSNLPAESSCLVFAGSLAHCYALAAAVRCRGVDAKVISHRTAAARRRRVLASFAEGATRVVINKSLLATGYDCPRVTDVVLASPVRSPILWEQIIGRVSRGPAVGGTEIGTVWELDNHRALHGRILSYARFLAQLWS